MCTRRQFKAAMAEKVKELEGLVELLSNADLKESGKVELELSKLSYEYIDRKIANVPTNRTPGFKGRSLIYVINAGKNYKSKIPELRKCLQEKIAEVDADENKVKAFPKLNQEKGTRTIYVGKSESLKSRLRLHLGGETKRPVKKRTKKKKRAAKKPPVETYALYLERWAKVVNMKIEIRYYLLPQMSTIGVLAIEDGIRRQLKPSFGKDGPN